MLKFDIPEDFFYPDRAVSSELFQQFLGYIGGLDSEENSYGQDGSCVNLLALEFTTAQGEVPPDEPIEHLLYFNYAQLSGNVNHNTNKIELSLGIPMNWKIRVSYLANRSHTGAMNTGDTDVRLVMMKSSWESRGGE